MLILETVDVWITTKPHLTHKNIRPTQFNFSPILGHVGMIPILEQVRTTHRGSLISSIIVQGWVWTLETRTNISISKVECGATILPYCYPTGRTSKALLTGKPTSNIPLQVDMSYYIQWQMQNSFLTE